MHWNPRHEVLYRFGIRLPSLLGRLAESGASSSVSPETLFMPRQVELCTQTLTLIIIDVFHETKY